MITINIHPNKTMHAAKHINGKTELLCSSLRYTNYYADITNQEPPTRDNVTCKKCLKKLITLYP
jgi:hypothetical protein